MGSTGTPNPWGPYDSYRDCSQGVCSVYCPQWCYVIFPPPPSFFLDDEDDSSSSDFSPLLIALIGILASAFILVSYYTLISRYCHRRREGSSSTSGALTRDRGISSSANDPWQGTIAAPTAAAGAGLDESLIRSITVYKYRKGDGFVESSDCSVCLSEFQENESLRLLPKCNHAFHVPCIDTWLKSHSNCPLCRAFIAGINATAAAAVSNQPISVHQTASESSNRGEGTPGIDSISSDIHHHAGDSVIVNLDLETRSRSETVSNVNGRSTPKPPELHGSRADGEDQVNRRSASLNSGAVMLIADILREIEDDQGDEESAGVGTSQRVEEGGGEKTPPASESAANQTSGISNFLVRSSMAMKRSVSTGKFVLSSCDRARNHRLPN